MGPHVFFFYPNDLYVMYTGPKYVTHSYIHSFIYIDEYTWWRPIRSLFTNMR